MNIIKTEYLFGAYIEGINLNEPLTSKEVIEIKNALSQNEVIFFRNQKILHSDHKS